MTPGERNQKVRKREVKSADGNTTIERFAYDAAGNRVRRIRADGTIERWVHSQDVRVVERYRNDELNRISEYDDAGRLVRRRIFSDRGVEDWMWEYEGEQTLVTFVLDGEEQWRRMRRAGEIVWQAWPSGRVREWIQSEDGRILSVDHRPDRTEPVRGIW